MSNVNGKRVVLEQVISGGQEGVDLAALNAARDLLIPTGGTAPKGWRICLPDGSDGSNPNLANYGLIEHASHDYPPRTIQNVQDSDGTLWIGYEHSGGGKLTISKCHLYGRPHIINPTIEAFRTWLAENEIRVLNVAGNREGDHNPGIYQQAYDFLFEALGPKRIGVNFEVGDTDYTFISGMTQEEALDLLKGSQGLTGESLSAYLVANWDKTMIYQGEKLLNQR